MGIDTGTYIADLATNMSQAQTLQDVGTSVLKMQMDDMKQMQELMTESSTQMLDSINRSAMENSVNTNLGSNIDMSI